MIYKCHLCKDPFTTTGKPRLGQQAVRCQTHKSVKIIFLTQCYHWCLPVCTASLTVMCRRGCFHSGCPRSSSWHHGSGYPPSPDTPVSNHIHTVRCFTEIQTIICVTMSKINTSVPSLCRNHIYPTWHCSPLPWGHLSPVHRWINTNEILMDKNNNITINVWMYTNLPECLTEELSSWLPPLSFIQAVVQHTRVVFHSIGFL